MRSLALSSYSCNSRRCGLPEQSRQSEKVAGPIQRRIPAYAKDCLDETSDSARMLTGEKLTAEQMATLEAKKKNEMHGANQRPTVLQRSRNRFLPHSSNAVSL